NQVMAPPRFLAELEVGGKSRRAQARSRGVARQTRLHSGTAIAVGSELLESRSMQATPAGRWQQRLDGLPQPGMAKPVTAGSFALGGGPEHAGAEQPSQADCGIEPTRERRLVSGEELLHPIDLASAHLVAEHGAEVGERSKRRRE